MITPSCWVTFVNVNFGWFGVQLRHFWRNNKHLFTHCANPVGPAVLGFPEIGTFALELFNPPMRPFHGGSGWVLECGVVVDDFWGIPKLQKLTKVYSTSRILRWMVVLCGLFDGHRCSLPPFLVLEGGRLRLLRSGKGRGAGKWNISGT